MNQQVDQVVAERVRRVAEDGVVEEIGERRDGTIEIAVGVRPPVRVLEDLRDVVEGELADPWILENDDLAVEDEGAGEGVGVGGDGQEAEQDGREPEQPDRCCGIRL